MSTKTDRSKPKSTESKGIPVSTVADTLGVLLNRVAFGREEIVITRHDKPIAKLVPLPVDATAL